MYPFRRPFLETMYCEPRLIPHSLLLWLAIAFATAALVENRVRFARHLNDLISDEIVALRLLNVKMSDTKYRSTVMIYRLIKLSLLE